MALKLSFIVEAIDKATAPIRAVNRMIESTTGPIARVNRSWSNLTGQVRGIGRDFGLLTAGIGAAFYPLHQVIGEGSKIHDFSQRLKISTTEFQRLAYAINQDGGSIEDAANALTFFQQNAAAAATGSQEMEMWFRRAGMSKAFLEANIKKPGGVQVMLERFADGMKDLSGPFQVQLAKALLGKGAGKVLQTMALGASGLKAAGDKAASLGIIISPGDLAKMDRAGDSMQDVWKVLRSLTALIAIAAIPLIEKVTSAIIGWSKALDRVALQKTFTEFFERLGESIPKIINAVTGLGAALGIVFGALNAFADFIGGWDNLIIGLVGARFALLIGAVVQLGIALGGTLPALVMFGAAFALPIAAVVGLSAAAYLIYRNWEPISDFFTELWESIKSAFGSAIEWISEKIAALTGLVGGFIVKLNELTPDFIKRFTLPGIVLNAAAGALAPQPAPSAIPPRPAAPESAAGAAAALGANAQRTTVGGTIRIEIDQQGRARVAGLQTDNRDVDLEVYSGQMMMTP